MAAERRTMFECQECKKCFLSMEVFVRHVCCTKKDTNSIASATATPTVATEFDVASIVLYDNISPEEVSNQISLQAEKEQSLSWSKEALVISEYKERQERIESGRLRKNKAFAEISEIMKRKGYALTSDQSSTRFKTITRAYKQIKDHNSRSGNNKKSYEYERGLDDLFGKRPNIQSEFVLSSAAGQSGTPKDLEKSATAKASKRPAAESENEEGNKSVSTPKSRKTQVCEVISYLETNTKRRPRKTGTKSSKLKKKRDKRKECPFSEI